MASTPPPINPSALVPYVGMYTIPIRLMGTAKSRGGNLLMKAELENGKVSRADWRAAARDNGFYYIDEYLSDDDVNDPWLLGWTLAYSDEWNRKRTRSGVDFYPDISPLMSQLDYLWQLKVRTGCTKWVHANADGMAVTASMFEKPPYNGMRGSEVPVMARLTLRTTDWYPVMKTSANTPSEIARRPMYLPAQALLRMQTWMDAAASNATPPVPGDYGCIVEANTGWNSPLAVTADEMRQQRDFLLGRAAFPFPSDPVADGRQAVAKKLTVLPKVWVWWTGNGQDGPGWKWIAQSDEQATCQAAITAELLGTAPQPAPDPEPPVVVPPVTPPSADYVTRAEWQAAVTDLYAKIAEDKLALKDAGDTIAKLADTVGRLGDSTADAARAAAEARATLDRIRAALTPAQVPQA